MAMSKKDYILIAASIKKTRDSYQPNWDANLFRALDDAARDLADALARQNQRFDSCRFLRACGVKLD